MTWACEECEYRKCFAPEWDGPAIMHVCEHPIDPVGHEDVRQAMLDMTRLGGCPVEDGVEVVECSVCNGVGHVYVGKPGRVG